MYSRFYHICDREIVWFFVEKSTDESFNSWCFLGPSRPHMWRFAVISFLTAALLAKLLSSVLSDRELWVLLADQYRWWSVKVDHFTSKDVRNPTERCSSFRRIAKRLWNQANIPSSSIAYPLFCQHLNKEQAPTFLLTFRICLQVA